MAEIIESIDRRSAQHYTWGNNCNGWHLVKTESLSIIEEKMPPGTSEIRHYHQKANQFFYVLKGNLQIEVEGNELVLNAGQGLHIEAGKRHQVFNRSSNDTEFMVVSNPPSHGDRIATD